MDFSSPIFIELILVLGGVLAFGFWQLYSLRRDKQRSETNRAGDQDAGGAEKDQ